MNTRETVSTILDAIPALKDKPDLLTVKVWSQELKNLDLKPDSVNFKKYAELFIQGLISKESDILEALETYKIAKLVNLQAIFDLSDTHGNKITCQGDKLFMKLKKDYKTRQLGRIEILDPENFHLIKRESESQTFRKTNAWSIPFMILKPLGRNGKITYISEKHTYTISTQRALDTGEIKRFNDAERKLYVPKKEWAVTV